MKTAFRWWRRCLVCLLCPVIFLTCIQGLVADEVQVKFEQAVAAVSKIKGLELSTEQRQEVLARWFKFGGTVARQQCNAAIAQGNLAVAESWAEKELQLASDCLTDTDKTRVASSMNLAKVRFLQRDKWDAALDAFEATADLAETGKHFDFQIEALMGTAAILLARDATDLIPVANLLKVSQAQGLTSPLYANSILFVWNRVWFPMYQQLGRDSESQRDAHAQFKAHLEKVSQQLIDEGVDQISANAGILLLPRMALDSLDLETARLDMKTFDTPEWQNQMPAFWQVQLL